MQHSGGSFVNLVASIETETNNNNISPYNNKKEVFLKQIHFFLLCDSCFWCASSLVDADAFYYYKHLQIILLKLPKAGTTTIARNIQNRLCLVCIWHE
jgi:hypothetical protein